MPLWQLSIKHISMTILQDNTAIVSDLVAGGQQSDVSMMIGVGVNKDSDAAVSYTHLTLPTILRV